MGIKDLKKLIKGQFKTSSIKESLIKNGNLSELAGEKVAIDISSYIYKYKVVNGDLWLNSMVMLICMIKRANVSVVFIFDGKPPSEKDEECKRRRNASNNIEDKVMNLSVDLDVYKDTNVISDLLRDTMKKIFDKDEKTGKKNKLLHPEKKDETIIDINAIKQFIEKKEGQNVKITKQDLDTLKEMILLFGGTFIQAPGEAEALAAYLFHKGEVKAVITEDTDILTYGVETYISGVNSVSGDCEVIYLSEVLKETELTIEEFRDFCIMCGCDYGNNIKGVGTATALKHIQKYKSIEKFIEENPKFDISEMNHINARELFTTYGRLDISIDYSTKYWEIIIDFDKLFKFLIERKIRFSAKNIEETWIVPEITFED